MRMILWWILTVSESVNCKNERQIFCISGSDWDSYKCGDECVDMSYRNCECGSTNLTYNDIFDDGKHCCTDQTCTGAKQNCENRNDSYSYNLNRNV